MNHVIIKQFHVIICDGFGSCSQSNIICPNNNLKQCEIICDGINSCSDVLSIACGTSEYCNIECNGLNACANINIECGINNNQLIIDMPNECKCNINGIETETLINSNIKCFILIYFIYENYAKQINVILYWLTLKCC